MLHLLLLAELKVPKKANSSQGIISFDGLVISISSKNDIALAVAFI